MIKKERNIIFLTQKVREAVGKNIERDGNFRFTEIRDVTTKYN